MTAIPINRGIGRVKLRLGSLVCCPAFQKLSMELAWHSLQDTSWDWDTLIIVS